MPEQSHQGSGRENGRPAYELATWFGAGLVRRGGGTLAAATILPFHWALGGAPIAVEVMLTTALVFAGIWAGHKVALARGEHDPQIVVVDEVAGALVALCLAHGHGVAGDLSAVALFRLFDIFKPWPIILFERGRHAGTAIMLDDIAAGLMAGAIVAAF